MEYCLPINRDVRGFFNIYINFDETPVGFEDAMEDSRFRRMLTKGSLTGEIRSPETSDLVRLLNIEYRMIAIALVFDRYAPGGIILKVLPYGPFRDVIQNRLNDSTRPPLNVVFRILLNDDEIADIITADIEAF